MYEATDYFRQWALSFSTESEYQSYIVPVLERTLLPNNLFAFNKILEKATKPKNDILFEQSHSNDDSRLSEYEKFLKNSFNSEISKLLFKKLIDFIPFDRKSFFICHFTNSISLNDLNRIIEIFPESQFKFTCYCRLFCEENAFMTSFSYLFSNYSKLSCEVKKYMNRCLRRALSLGICKDKFEYMIRLIFQIAKQGNNNNDTLDSIIEANEERVKIEQMEQLNVFFSALTDDTTILMKYCSLKKIDHLFDQCEIRNYLPPSFLRFLIFTSANYTFTNEQFWSFAVSAPTLMFSYINHLDDLANESMWIQILSATTTLRNSFELQSNVFLAYLHCVLQRPEIMSVFIELRIHDTLPKILESNIKKISVDHSLASLLILYLSFCRINEETAKNFQNSILNRIDFFKSLSESKNFFMEDALLWILAPSTPFPFEGMIKLENEQILSLFPYPSFSFIKEIAPKILRTMLLQKNDRILAKILKMYSPENAVLFKELSSPDILKEYIEKTESCDLHYKYLTTALSISCDFSIFSPFFQSICTDIEKTIDFLTILSKQMMLVDDFLHINKDFSITASLMSGTIIMWIRTLTNVGIILNIKTSDIKIEIWYEFDDFYLSVNDKVITKISNTSSIEKWRFVALSISQKSISFSVNLETFTYPLTLRNITNFSVGSKYGIFDLQSLKVQRPILNFNQIILHFALGPNYKESMISDFISFKDQQPFFAQRLSYISKLYIKWSDIFNISSNLSENNNLLSNTELSISPPFQSKSSSRRSTSNILLIDDTYQLLCQRFSFIPFFNSFDALGGLNFLIHIWAEVILKQKTLISKMFDLIDVLINRIPIVHHYFMRNSIYCLIGQLMKQVSFDALPLAFSHDVGILTNVNIIRYWILGPALDRCKIAVIKPFAIANKTGSSDSIKGLIPSDDIEQKDSIEKSASIDSLKAAVITKSESNESFKTNGINRNESTFELIQFDLSDKERYELIDKEKFTNIILTLIDISQNPLNLQFLSKSKAFVIIIQHISQGTYTPEFLKLLRHLALTITTQENCYKHALFIFNHLMIQHLRFSKQCNESTSSSVALVRLLFSVLDTFEGLNKKLSLELMIPAVVNTSNYQADLIELLIHFLDESMYYIFSVVLNSLSSTKEVSERLYKDTVRLISPRDKTSDYSPKIHFIVFPLVYFSAHIDYSQYFFALCAVATLVLDSYNNFPSYIYEQVLQMICSVESSDEQSSALVPQTITQDFPSFSTTTSPFSPFIVSFLSKALMIKEYCHVKKFFISIFAIPTIAVYRKSALSLFLLGKMFEKIDNVLDFPIKKLEPFLKFVLSYGSFVFKKIQMIPGDKTESLSSIFCYFIRETLIFIEKCDSAELINAANVMLTDFSTLNSISSLVVDDLKNVSFISKYKIFEKTIHRLQNPMSYAPIKILPQKFEKTLETLSQKFLDQNKTNKSGLLTIWCNSVHYQTTAAGEIIIVDENGEKIIETWHSIFNSLLIPSSRIYENCPKKYKISDSTTRFERRRILYPIVPSSDPIYTSFYKTKYHSTLPEIRLTLSNVLENTSLTLWHSNNVKFSGDAVRLTGISLCRGILVILDQNEIKFYQKSYENVLTFDADHIKFIRLLDYMHQPRGILIEDRNDNVYLFAFEAQSIRDCFVEICESNKMFVVQKDIDLKEIELLQTQWCDGLLSNFEYLLKLNFISGRTWADFTQFPMFPWTIIDFKSEKINLTDPKTYRSFEYPYFAQSDQQKEACQKYYASTAEVTECSPHHYPNYISNVGSTLYFLVRLEPFTDAELDFQGGNLDAADRTFQSFQITSDLMTTPGAKSALELVPECYFIPEMLENNNGISFNVSPINQRDISEVTLPPWCRSPIEFVEIMRDALESDIVSSSLNEWIDLIWGVRRKGKLGHERYNIIQDIVFDFNPEEYMNDYLLMKAMVEQIHNCGQAPKQLFSSFHPKRRVLQSMKEIQLVYLCEKTPEDEVRKTASSNLYHHHMPIVSISNESICVYRNSTTAATFRFSKEIKPVAIDAHGSKFATAHDLPLVNHWALTSKGLKYIATLRGRPTKISRVLINATMAIILAGHIDGYISIFSTNPHQFIREIRGMSSAPIEMMRVLQSKSNILSFQRENDEMTIISLWTINGALLAVMKIPEKIIDCTMTHFAEGTRRNVIILLTDRDELIVLRAESLEEKERFRLKSTHHISLQIWKNGYKYNLFVTKEDRSHSVYALND